MRRTFKNTLVLAVAACLLPMLLLGSVSSATKLVIGASFVSKDNQWWATTGKFAIEAAENRGAEIILLFANNNQEKQIKDVEDLVQKKIDVLLLGPVQAEGSATAVEACKAAGIPVVTIARTSTSPYVSTGVVFDEPLLGANQAKQLIKDFPNGANVVYLFGPVGASYPIAQYEQGFLKEIEKAPSIKILNAYKSATDTSADGMKNAEDALVRYKNIDAICATNDDLAMGAVRAVEAAGKTGKILVYGGSALPIAMQAMYDGAIHFTQLKSQSKIADKAVELALKVANKEKVEKMYFLEPMPITKATMGTAKDAVFGGTLAAPMAFEPKK